MRSRFVLTALLVVILLRFFTLGTFALLDPTEGRYASIAQQMYLTQDWITPMTFAKGELVPFLAKPPLQTWMTAIAYTFFGMTEFASRLPSFFAGVIVIGMTVYFGNAFFSLGIGLLAGLLLASSTLFFFISGACMTDTFLVLGTCLSGLSYFKFSTTVGKKSTVWGGLFFVSLAIGILAKGPLALALVALSIIPWLYFTRSFSQLRRLPWIGGIALFSILSVPWYLAVEYRNPGFFRYFVINEHILRFLSSSYGDKYGTAHIHYYGTIWLMLLGAFFPWSLLWVAALFKRNVISFPKIFSGNASLFCLSWGLSPVVLFTFTQQTSIYYVLPSLPWLSLLTAVLVKQLLESSPKWLMGIMRGNFFMSLVGGLGGTIIGYITGAPVITTALAAFVLITLFSLWMTLAKPNAHWTAIAGSPASTVILFSLLMVTMSHFVNAQYSTRALVDRLESGVSPPVIFAGFVGKIPQSAFFYSREEPNIKLTFGTVPKNEKPQEEFRYVITKSKNVQNDILTTLSEFSVKTVDGGWTLLEKH